jgi:hypothetical protein
MNTKAVMIRAISAMAFLMVLCQTNPAIAETCNAGHGCSISCADGCSAIYNHDTGQCSTSCGEPVSVSDQKDKRGHISAVFQDKSRKDIDALLKGLDKKAPAKK